MNRVSLGRTVGAALLLTLCACGSSATQAVLVAGVPPAHEAPANAERYVLTSENAKIEVRINGFASLTLRFPDVSGELAMAPDAPELSLANLVVTMKTAQADNEELGDIAKSKDFLDVETYPETKFEVRRLTKKPTGKYEMIGLLELHGTQRAITVPFELVADECNIKAKTEFSINRRHFGIESDTMVDGMASDDVDIKLRVNLRRTSAGPICQ